MGMLPLSVMRTEAFTIFAVNTGSEKLPSATCVKNFDVGGGGSLK